MFGAHYALGVDGIGLTLVLLTAILSPVVILASWNDGDDGRWGVNAFFAWMLALEGLALGVFAATDVFLFYVLFEATLIPIYFLIGGFGGPRRSYAAVKFLLFSLFGGLLMLASVVGLYVVSADAGAADVPALRADARSTSSRDTGRWLFLGFFIAFAIKAPMVPVHTWLPDAAERGARPALGAAGQHPRQDRHLRDDPVLPRAVPGGVEVGHPGGAGAGRDQRPVRRAAAIGQNDIPRLIAYTSVSHFGFIVLGIFVLTSYGQSGSMLYMFNHGLSTAALFLVTGFLIKRRGSQLIPRLRRRREGRASAGRHVPGRRAVVSCRCPASSPFVSEFLVLLGAFTHAGGRPRRRRSASCWPRSTSC